MRRQRGFFDNDPRWITAKYPARCRCCQSLIKAGERAFWWPSSKTMDCDKDACGRQSSRDFKAAKQDEQFMTQGVF